MNQNIIFEVKNKLGVIILNRPKALNALNGDMFLSLREKLLSWQDNPAIKAVLIRSSSEKAFCAGGDIRAIYENKHQSADEIARYFQLEYSIDRLIFEFPKPYIALLNGITMGGGVGVSIHGSHSIAATNLRWGMPETRIGFFPDVGASYYLSRLPHHIGTYLALTGNSISADEAVQLNLVQSIMSFNQFDALEKKLSEADFDLDDLEATTKVIRLFSQPVNTVEFDYVEEIKASFCFPTVEAIMAALLNQNTAWSLETLQQLRQRSPTSLKVTLKQLQLAKEKTIEDVIKMDLHIAQIMLTQPDFFEGVRATIIDKDKNPKWQPIALVDISDTMVAKYF